MYRGFYGIEREAAEKLSRLPNDGASLDRRAFYRAVIELCQGIQMFSERYACHAEQLATTEKDSRTLRGTSGNSGTLSSGSVFASTGFCRGGSGSVVYTADLPS